MKHIITLTLLLVSIVLSAQTTVGLVAYYPFNDQLVDATGNSANIGIAQGGPTYRCGVAEQALSLDGFDDQVNFIGPVVNEFDTEDLTISFYFKPTGLNGTQYLISKRSEFCDDQQVFYIRYAPNGRTVNVFLSENASKNVSIVERIDNDACWQHLTLVRQNTRVKLYLNGEFAQELGTTTRIDLLNDGELILGGGVCFGANETNFAGIIDELRIYNRALKEEEIVDLYSPPDMIQTRDTLIFLGNSIDVALSNTCASNFSWSPTDGVSNPFVAEPNIEPPVAGIQYYYIDFGDNISSCVATDSIRINVIDPDELDCATAFLPKAFTPNGDGLNDTYGISNPFAIQEFISLEIFDRWGSRVFFTEDVFAKWDGTFHGKEVNPGVMLYKVRFRCEGEEKLEAGSLTILK